MYKKSKPPTLKYYENLNSTTTFHLPQGLALAGNIGAMNYFECSAMTGLGMEEIAREAIRVVEAKRNPPPPPPWWRWWR